MLSDVRWCCTFTIIQTHSKVKENAYRCIGQNNSMSCTYWSCIKDDILGLAILGLISLLLNLVISSIHRSGNRALIAQLVATRAVNQGVVSPNPSSANTLSDLWQISLWQASFVFHKWLYKVIFKEVSFAGIEIKWVGMQIPDFIKG